MRSTPGRTRSNVRRYFFATWLEFTEQKVVGGRGRVSARARARVCVCLYVCMFVECTPANNVQLFKLPQKLRVVWGKSQLLRQ